MENLYKFYECTAYLGVELSYNISWCPDILKLCDKLAQEVAILRRIKQKIPQSTLCILYHTIIQPHIDYCLTVWGYAPDIYIDKVQRMQNRAARVVSGVYDWSASGIYIVNQVGRQTVRDRRDYFMCVLMHCGVPLSPVVYKSTVWLYVGLGEFP